MGSVIQKHRQHWSDPRLVSTTIWSVVVFLISIYINYWANNYAQQAAKNALTDIILNNVPVVNVSFMMSWGVLILIIWVAFVLFRHPARIPFALKSLSLFILVRSIFISVTHIAQFSPQALLDTGTFFNFIGSGNTGGLFFSGHTGVPFLFAMMFWEDLPHRLIFLGASIAFAMTVLLGHLHYTIDVLGAFFITYTIYHLAMRFFPWDLKLFNQSLD